MGRSYSYKCVRIDIPHETEPNKFCWELEYEPDEEDRRELASGYHDDIDPDDLPVNCKRCSMFMHRNFVEAAEGIWHKHCYSNPIFDSDFSLHAFRPGSYMTPFSKRFMNSINIREVNQGEVDYIERKINELLRLYPDGPQRSSDREAYAETTQFFEKCKEWFKIPGTTILFFDSD